jgi:hypothetical protein
VAQRNDGSIVGGIFEGSGGGQIVELENPWLSLGPADFGANDRCGVVIST